MSLSPLHEAIVELFRHQPGLAKELLERVGGVVVPRDARPFLASETAPKVDPVNLAADAVVLLGGERATDAPRGVLIIEVQLDPNRDKHYAWPFYIASHRHTHRCPVWLLVVTLDESVARWAAKPIELGHPGLTLTPIVLGPSNLPAIIDRADAQRHPELAVLSALAHAHDQAAVPTATAALSALGLVDEDMRSIYNDAVLARLGDAAKAVLEELMQQGQYEFQSAFAKENYGKGKAEGRTEGKAEGRAEGKAEGRAEGKAEAILDVLAGRGIAATEEEQTRIRSCQDLAILKRWLVRAVTASSVEALLAD